ncbi:GDP-mannose 4,6-dehydratase [Nocardioides sp. LHG3406-4]|uniref:GDP-mannose 4,6-dehydratase n=1 Tax=Nocardioides sp. LHG3406-4 TaxID=2804575 RepID=UPI003CF4330E
MTVAFVTGIGGQDGGYLADALLARGVEVHGLVRGAGPAFVHPDVTLHAGDLTDADAVRGLLLDLAPDEVYNLAAISSVAQSWQHPDAVRRVNGDAAVELMASSYAVMLAQGRPVRFVQASSAEIFGQPAATPQDEATPLAPTNPYGESKAVAHRAVGTWRARGLPAVSAILYNHESPRRPERFVTRRITRGVAEIAHGRADTLVLGNLDARRDWGWAPDHVDALVRAARHPVAQDYVVATGETHSVRDFAVAALAHAGIDDWERHLRTDEALVRPSDAAELCGDSTRARRDLGWQPTRSFTEVVAAMVDADLAR